MLGFDLTLGNAAQISCFPNVFSLNGYKPFAIKDTLNRYLPLQYLINDIQTNRITFSSPFYWQDSFETRYYELNYQQKYSYFSEPSINSLCFTSRHATNEDAMWRRYAKVGEEMVNAEINLTCLLNELSDSGVRNGFSVYLGEVIYCDKREILNITPSSRKFGAFFNTFTLEKYLTLLCLKRCAFSYENEIRIFVVFNNNRAKSTTLKIPVGNSLIYSRLTVSPYPPIYTPFPQPDYHDGMESRKKKVINSCPAIYNNICVSHLFDKCPKCKL